MSQNFDQRAYQYHTVYQPASVTDARNWYGQPPPPFVAADQYTVRDNNNNNNVDPPAVHQQQYHHRNSASRRRRDTGSDDDDDDEEEEEEDDDDTDVEEVVAAAAAVAAYAPVVVDSEDSSDSETDDPATRVAKQLLRKGGSKSKNNNDKAATGTSKTPARYDFKKSKVRVRIREAKASLDNAQHAVQEAERAFQIAKQSLQDREDEWKKLNEELVDELLEAEKMRPWNKVYFQLAAYKKEHGHVAIAARAMTNRRRQPKENNSNSNSNSKSSSSEQQQQQQSAAAAAAVATQPSEQESHEEFLGGWISRQRGDRNKGKLDEWKILALDRLGFTWEGLDSMWQNTYQKVKNYYNEHGHINITVKQDKPLNRWLKTQRQTYKDYKASGFVEPGKFGCKMNKERKDLLDALGMDWGDEEEDEKWWIRPFNQLRLLQKRQGHLRTLPAKETALIEFVKQQRAGYQKYLANGCKDSFEMTAERITLLDSIWFPWTGTDTPFVEGGGSNINQNNSPKKGGSTTQVEEVDKNNSVVRVISHYNPWMTQYNKVKAFICTYGHLVYTAEADCEPLAELEKMEKWDAAQRAFAESIPKKKYLTPERLDLLNGINFFQPKHEIEFSLRLSQLRKFRLRHGHCMIMFAYPGAPPIYKALADWADLQRKEYQKLRNGSSSTLNEQKVAMMLSLGFNFNLELPTNTTPTATATALAADMPAAQGILAMAQAPPKKSPPAAAAAGASGSTSKAPSKRSSAGSSTEKSAAKAPPKESNAPEDDVIDPGEDVGEPPKKKSKKGRSRMSK